MRAARALIWLAALATAGRALGFLVMAVDGYDFSSDFGPGPESAAAAGFGMVVLAEFAFAFLMLAAWIVMSINVSAVRNRLPDDGWDHSSAAIWLWWLVPIAWFWMPRAVYLEVADRARPEKSEENRSAVNRWWGWFLAFVLSPVALLFLTGEWALFAAATITATLAAVAAASASRMLARFPAPLPVSPAPGSYLATGTQPTVPGWYYDPTGHASHQAWWDGTRWTGATRPAPGDFPNPNH